MANYIWGWQVPEYEKAIDYDKMSEDEKEKARYVNGILDKSVSEAHCGWYGIAYVVTENAYGDHTEWTLMFGGKEKKPSDARWIPVTGSSMGAVAEAVWSLVFR